MEREIIIYNENNREVIAIVNVDDSVIAKNGVKVIVNFDKNNKIVEEKDGLMYVMDIENN